MDFRMAEMHNWHGAVLGAHVIFMKTSTSPSPRYDDEHHRVAS
jgi:hypothetical protein